MVNLKASKLFHALGGAELEGLEKTVEVRRAAAGSVLFTEGDPGDGLYVVESGIIEISAMIGAQERRPLGRILAGDFFGEMAVLDDEPRSASAVAATDAVVWFIPRHQILAALDNSPKLAVNLVREFSLRMRDFNRQYISEVLQAERLTLVGRFARSIVHDFKNPLNVIGIAAELGCDEGANAAARTASKTRIRKQVDRLSNMINELLEFTRGTQSSNVLALADYASYVLPILDELRPEISLKGVAIELENQPPSVLVPIDPSRLTHVFFNLINNAVDAMMPEGGRIILRFQTDARNVITEIEDTGNGIAPEIASRLFEAFATYGKAQGTGLGLSICRRIIADHRGSIEARSEAGRGAIFRFTLPRPEA